MSTLRIVIVEDSTLARGELRCTLEELGGCEIVAEAANVQEGVAAIEATRPDLVLLDIQLPDGDGFSLLEQLKFLPEVIFTTAFDQYALRAFDVNALAYLQKPIERERLAAALQRVREKVQRQSEQAPANPRKHRGDQIFIKDGERCYFVRLAEVALFEVEGNYTRVYFRDQRPLLARALNYLEGRLEPSQFFRTGRRHIVNLDFVQNIDADVGDGLILTLRGGRTIEVSRRQARELRDLLAI